MTPKSIVVGEWLAKRRKALVPVATFIATALALPQFPESDRLTWTLVLLALNAVGVHQVRNEP